MTKLLASAVFAAALVAAPAYAVNIENQDGIDHEVTIAVGEGGPVTFKLKAGEKKMDVCGGEHCVLMLNESDWEGYGAEDETIAVRDGKLSRPAASPRG